MLVNWKRHWNSAFTTSQISGAAFTQKRAGHDEMAEYITLLIQSDLQ